MGHVSDIVWVFFGHVLDMCWTCFLNVLDIVWTCLEYVLDMFGSVYFSPDPSLLSDMLGYIYLIYPALLPLKAGHIFVIKALLGRGRVIGLCNGVVQ